MDTSDIVRILSEDRRVGPLFAGVFARDQFVRFARHAHRDYVAVFNTHDSRRPGEHWIAYVRLNGLGRYFDSYGRSPTAYPDVHAALRSSRPSRDVLWNAERLQGLTTTACGDYCVLFALLTCRGWTMRRFVTRLTRLGAPERRDHALRATVLRLYGRDAMRSLREVDDAYIGHDRLHATPAVVTLALTRLRHSSDISFH